MSAPAERPEGRGEGAAAQAQPAATPLTAAGVDEMRRLARMGPDSYSSNEARCFAEWVVRLANEVDRLAAERTREADGYRDAQQALAQALLDRERLAARLAAAEGARGCAPASPDDTALLSREYAVTTRDGQRIVLSGRELLLLARGEALLDAPRAALAPEDGR